MYKINVKLTRSYQNTWVVEGGVLTSDGTAGLASCCYSITAVRFVTFG